ncbi:MAG TPA: hypothetical protein VIK96_04650 [Bacilli bacterium]
MMKTIFESFLKELSFSVGIPELKTASIHENEESLIAETNFEMSLQLRAMFEEVSIRVTMRKDSIFENIHFAEVHWDYRNHEGGRGGELMKFCVLTQEKEYMSFVKFADFYRIRESLANKF